MSLACYITFPSTYYTLRAEAVLRDMDFHFRLEPVPRALSSSCGTALRCECSQVEAVRKILEQTQVEFEGVHRLEVKSGKRKRNGLWF